ncbi:hypothetical protein [Stenotrophomonas sp. SrG]|uniref:hypothetical protein n=1 Tax=Stenotrophomonas sp. SrG TaxID=3414430 RepID=UPI003CEBBA05
MARQIIDTTTNNGAYIGDPAKVAFGKVNDNFEELYQKAADLAQAVAKSSNLLINGDFRVWQNGTGFVADGYTADMWSIASSGASYNAYRQASVGEGISSGFALAVAVSASGTGLNVRQRVENIQTVAGGRYTLSFKAKGNFGGMGLACRFTQNFGSGGSASVGIPGVTSNLTTSIQKFSFTFDAPSAAGKTVGANSFFEVIFDFLGTGTYQISDVKLVPGENAGDFDSLGDAYETLRCMRHFQKSYDLADVPGTSTRVGAYVSGILNGYFLSAPIPPFLVPMRATPAVTIYAARNGQAGNGSEVNAGGVFVANRVITAGNIGQKSFQAGGANTLTAGSTIEFHWTANARL